MDQTEESKTEVHTPANLTSKHEELSLSDADELLKSASPFSKNVLLATSSSVSSSSSSPASSPISSPRKHLGVETVSEVLESSPITSEPASPHNKSPTPLLYRRSESSFSTVDGTTITPVTSAKSAVYALDYFQGLLKDRVAQLLRLPHSGGFLSQTEVLILDFGDRGLDLVRTFLQLWLSRPLFAVSSNCTI